MAPSNNEIDSVSIESAYQAARSGVIVVDQSDAGILRFSGETRLDLINRMSTQKVDNLKSSEGAATVLTSDIGRILDRLILYADQDTVTCLTGSDNGDNIARYLMRFVFFMDDFQIEDLSQRTALLALYGSGVKDIIDDFLPESADLPLHHWFKTEIEGLSVTVHRTDPVVEDGYLIICHSEVKAKIFSHLISAGVVPASHDAFDYLRIESGLPVFGHELTSDYIPLEAGLRSDISFNKGCYTGQEIIARMDSRGKLAKRLVKLASESPIQAGTGLKAGGKNAGTITSAADGPNGPLALGYVRSAYLDGSTPLSADGEPVSII